MKRGLGLALLLVATSVVVSAQIHGIPPSVTSFGPGRGPTPGIRASVTSLGPFGWSGGFFDNRFGAGFAFGHHPRFFTSFGDQRFRHHFFPQVVPFYVPYYVPYGDYGYDPSAYQQQPNQPVIVMADPGQGDDRYGDHSFAQDRAAQLPPAQADPQPPPAPPREQEPTVIVFTDGHKQEVRNYAIVGQMLWDFTAQGTHKIPLSQIDIEATRKLNDDRGVEFVLPKS